MKGCEPGRPAETEIEGIRRSRYRVHTHQWGPGGDLNDERIEFGRIRWGREGQRLELGKLSFGARSRDEPLRIP